MAVAVIFTSQRRLGADGRPLDEEGYLAANAEMMRLAAARPGFLGVTGARDDRGLGITVSYWQTEEHARAWGRVAAHRSVQERGRTSWYEWYRVQRAEVTGEWAHPRANEPRHK